MPVHFAWRSAFQFAFLFFSLPAWGAAELTFLSPEIQNADAESLRRKIQQGGDSSSASELERALRGSALATLESEALHPHAAYAAWLAVENLCAGWRSSRFEAFNEKGRARAAAACVLAGAELTARGLPLKNWGRARKLAADLQVFSLGDLPEAERLHLTGRLRSALSPAFGQDFKTALLSWRVLERVQPEAPGTDYWLGLTLQRQGNTPAAAASFLTATKLPVPDARAARQLQRRQADEPDFGWSPLFFSTPARGLGLGVRLFDDRVFDTGRSLELNARASLRGNGWGGICFEEGEWTAPLVVRLKVRGASRLRDFFAGGLVPGSTSVEFRANDILGSAELALPWGDWEIGARAALIGFSEITPAPVGQSGDGGTLFGGSLVWDTRDRRALSRRGWLVEGKVESVVPRVAPAFVQAMGSVQSAWWLSLRHSMGVSLAVGSVSGPVPYNFLLDLSAGLPGIREMRYLTRATAGFSVQYHYALLPWLRLGAFGTLGAAGVDLASLPSNLRAGGGIDAEFVLERSPKHAPRWELGFFNGEWVFQGGLRTDF